MPFSEENPRLPSVESGGIVFFNSKSEYMLCFHTLHLTHGRPRFITFIAVAAATIDLLFVLTSPASFVRVHVRVQRRLRRIIHLFTNARETRGKKLR